MSTVKRKLGKLAPKQDVHTPMLCRYLTGHLPVPLSAVDWSGKVKEWPMMLNDQLGNCTCAAVGHMIQCWTANSTQQTVVPDSAIVSLYSFVSGYNPKTGANDNGAIETDVLRCWKRKGVDGHHIDAFAAVEPGNHDHVKLSVSDFGGLYIGVALPKTVEAQTDAGLPWTVGDPTSPDSKPGSWGGHAVPIIAYNANFLTCVTWGKLQLMSWQFWDSYCDEAYAVVSEDWLNALGVSPYGVNLQALLSDLKQM